MYYSQNNIRGIKYDGNDILKLTVENQGVNVWNTFNMPYKELNIFLKLSIPARQVLSTTEENKAHAGLEQHS
jgi:hypothetical protein